MSAIFISYTGRDPEGDAWADRLSEWFEEWGYGYFRDTDHRHGVKPGEDWRAELSRKLRLAPAMICLCSRHYVCSQWCVGEMAIAVEKGKTVIPIQLLENEQELKTTALPLHLQPVQAIKVASASNPSSEQLQEVKHQLREQLKTMLNWRSLLPWPPPEELVETPTPCSPFPGLPAFEERQAPVFFGRDQKIEAVVEGLKRLALQTPAFLLLLGASGCGKSSLVRAGVVPRLRAGSDRRWQVLTPFTPGSFPFERLSLVLNEAEALLTRPAPPGEGVADEPALLRRLQRLQSEARAPVVLVIDQFEELLSDPGGEEEQPGVGARFLAFLQNLLSTPKTEVLLLATMRTDFLAPLQSTFSKLTGLASKETLEPIALADFGELISGPAKRSGLELQPGLRERLVNDSVGRDALPLLAFTLDRLREKRQKRGGPATGPRGESWDLTVADYEELGGVEGSVRTQAERCWTPGTSDAAEEADLREAFLSHLLAIDVDGRVAKRPACLNSLPDRSKDIVARLVNARLLVSDEGVVEIANEILLRTWDPLVRWIEEGRGDLQEIKQLEPDLERWRQASKLNKLRTLLPDLKLSKAKDLLGKPSPLLKPEMRAFIETSMRWRMIWRGALFVCVAAVVVFSVYFSSIVHNQNVLKSIVDVREQVDLARAYLSTNEAVHGMIQAIAVSGDSSKSETITNEIVDTVFKALDQANEMNKMQITPGYIKTVALSPDGTQIVSGSTNSNLQLWDSRTGKAIGDPFKGHSDWVLSVAFSPDGGQIISGSKDKTLRLWDAKTGQQIGSPFEGHDGAVRSVAFSPDGKTIVSGSADTTIRLWNAETGKQIGLAHQDHTGWINSVAFNPDGSQIVSGADDNKVFRWDTRSMQVIRPLLKGHTDGVKAVAYSRDGKRIVSGSMDKTIRQWDANTGQTIGNSIKTEKEVFSVEYSPNGEYILSGHADGKLSVRQAETGELIPLQLQGHAETVNSVIFTHQGDRIVSGSDDGSLRVWDAPISESNRPVVYNTSDHPIQAAFSPDGSRFVTASSDNTIQIFSAIDGMPTGRPLTGHSDRVTSVAFSFDGRLIASGSDDKTVRIWDVMKQEPIGTPIVLTEPVTSLAFSQDSKKIVSGADDGTVEIWTISTRKPLGHFKKVHSDTIRAVAFSPNGKQIASAADDKKLIEWNALTGETIHFYLNHKGPVTSVAFSPDGLRLISGSTDKTLQVWETTSGKPIGRPLKGHSDEIMAVAVSPDGRQIISGSADTTLRLWNLSNGKIIGKPFKGHSAAVSSVAFIHNGRRVISTSDDNTLRSWDVDIKTLVARACDRIRYHQLLLAPAPDFKDVSQNAKRVCEHISQRKV